jgi:hypothetical protein
MDYVSPTPEPQEENLLKKKKKVANVFHENEHTQIKISRAAKNNEKKKGIKPVRALFRLVNKSDGTDDSKHPHKSNRGTSCRPSVWCQVYNLQEASPQLRLLLLLVFG